MHTFRGHIDTPWGMNAFFVTRFPEIPLRTTPWKGAWEARKGSIVICAEAQKSS
jgi:hypothetical protein